jgi:hypothetical protein
MSPTGYRRQLLLVQERRQSRNSRLSTIPPPPSREKICVHKATDLIIAAYRAIAKPVQGEEAQEVKEPAEQNEIYPPSGRGFSKQLLTKCTS